MRLVFTSDTHGKHRDVSVPECDVFFHCGDMSGQGEYSIYADLVTWMLKTVKARHYVIIPGNHDITFETHEDDARAFFNHPNMHVLINQGVVIEGLKIWGSPWTLRFYDWAFNADPGEQIQKHWDKIPAGLDVLMTHQPAFGYGDFIPGRNRSVFDAPGILEKNGGLHVGCPGLLSRIIETSPKIHGCGHIHEGAGRYVIPETNTQVINAAFLDGKYRPRNLPAVIDYTP